MERLNALTWACFNVDPIPNLNKNRLVAVSSRYDASSSSSIWKNALQIHRVHASILNKESGTADKPTNISQVQTFPSVVRSYEEDTTSLGSMQDGEFHGLLIDCLLLKKGLYSIECAIS